MENRKSNIKFSVGVILGIIISTSFFVFNGPKKEHGSKIWHDKDGCVGYSQVMITFPSNNVMRIFLNIKEKENMDLFDKMMKSKGFNFKTDTLASGTILKWTTDNETNKEYQFFFRDFP